MLHHKKTQLSPFLLTFLCSLLIHSPLVFLYWAPLSQNTKEIEEENLVLVEYPVHQQIVSQKTFNNIIPETQTSYLSQANKTVEKETQAMLKGLFYQAKTENLNLTAKTDPKEPRQLQTDKPIKRQTSSLKPVLLNKIKEPIQTDIAKIEHMDFFQQPQKQDLSRTMDFLLGVETGSHTLLNTKEFTYYSYFSRMKEQLYWRWTQYFKRELPLTSLRLITGNRQKLFSTSLYVYLSPDGEIQDIRVVESSGAENIDSAALHAFLSAAPFPNPPKGLIEEDGHIHIKQSFHLYINSYLSEYQFSRKN